MVELLDLHQAVAMLNGQGDGDVAGVVSDALDEIVSLRRRLDDAQAENRRLHAIELQANSSGSTRKGAHW